MDPAVSPSLLKQLLTGFKFDPELAKNLDFDDFVEQQPLSLAAVCTSCSQDEEDTDQLLLAASQAYEETVARGPQLFRITSTALGITVGINESS